MFEIGFWELLLIGVIALLVIGPERLPEVARTVGATVGRMRRFVTSVKSDINQELKAGELKQILEKQAGSQSLYDFIDEAKSSVSELERDMNWSGRYDSSQSDPAMSASGDEALPPPPAIAPPKAETPVTPLPPAPSLSECEPSAWSAQRKRSSYDPAREPIER
jgi:sec-independent protein translocase protein TatB